MNDYATKLDDDVTGVNSGAGACFDRLGRVDTLQPETGAGERISPSRDDADPFDRLACVFPDVPADVIAIGVQAVAEAFASPGAIPRLILKLADVEDERDRHKARLAATEKTRDDAIDGGQRWIERADRLELQRDALKVANQAAGELIRESLPAVRLVNDWATWSDESLWAYADAILRKFENKSRRSQVFEAIAEIRCVARDRLGDDGFTIPPAYDDEARARAAEAVRRRASVGEVKETVIYHVDNPPTIADLYGATVDAVAQALGMRRAGA